MLKQKGNKFYTFGNDIIFKNVFNGFDTLKRLLEETLNIKINDIFQSNTELEVSNTREKKQIVDY